MMTDYTTWPKRSITLEQWNNISSGYKNIREDGTKTLLVLEKGETTLAVVTIINGYSAGKGARHA